MVFYLCSLKQQRSNKGLPDNRWFHLLFLWCNYRGGGRGNLKSLWGLSRCPNGIQQQGKSNNLHFWWKKSFGFWEDLWILHKPVDNWISLYWVPVVFLLLLLFNFRLDSISTTSNPWQLLSFPILSLEVWRSKCQAISKFDLALCHLGKGLGFQCLQENLQNFTSILFFMSGVELELILVMKIFSGIQSFHTSPHVGNCWKLSSKRRWLI